MPSLDGSFKKVYVTLTPKIFATMYKPVRVLKATNFRQVLRELNSNLAAEMERAEMPAPV